MKEIWMKSSELFQKIETEKLETRNVCAQTWFKFQNRTSTESKTTTIPILTFGLTVTSYSSSFQGRSLLKPSMWLLPSYQFLLIRVTESKRWRLISLWKIPARYAANLCCFPLQPLTGHMEHRVLHSQKKTFRLGLWKLPKTKNLRPKIFLVF